MRTLQKERLKDMIIDIIYNNCYTEIVKVIENDPVRQAGYGEEDPYMQKIYDTFIKPSGSVKMFHDLRKATHCRLIDDGKVVESLNEAMRQRGYRINDRTYEDVSEALDYLTGRSYLVRNIPVRDEYSLTPKGLNHYSSGRSFEDAWIAGSGSRRAVMLSWISFAVVLASLAAAILVLK